MPPFDEGDASVMEQITTEVKSLAAGVKARDDKRDGEIKSVKEWMANLEKKINRSKLGGSGGDELVGDLKAEHKALASHARTGDDTPLREYKAMSVGSDPDGGYFVMPALSNSMTTRLFDITPMRRLARVETITAGDAWEEPLDLGDVGAEWVGETETRPATSTPNVGMQRVPLNEIYAMPTITQRLLDDVGFDLGAWLEGKIADRFGRTEGSAFVIGNGVKKPRGFLTYDTESTADATRAWGKLQYVASGNANTITPDAVKQLTWKLRSPYRQGAAFLMNTNTASLLDTLKDGNGNYLWRMGLQAGAPPTLLNFPVEFSEDMPDASAGTYPIAFGNWERGYVIVDRAGIRSLRDPYTNKPNVLFYAYKRVGGDVSNFEAIKLLKVAVS